MILEKDYKSNYLRVGQVTFDDVIVDHKIRVPKKRVPRQKEFFDKLDKEADKFDEDQKEIFKLYKNKYKNNLFSTNSMNSRLAWEKMYELRKACYKNKKPYSFMEFLSEKCSKGFRKNTLLPDLMFENTEGWTYDLKLKIDRNIRILNQHERFRMDRIRSMFLNTGFVKYYEKPTKGYQNFVRYDYWFKGVSVIPVDIACASISTGVSAEVVSKTLTDNFEVLKIKKFKYMDLDKCQDIIRRAGDKDLIAFCPYTSEWIGVDSHVLQKHERTNQPSNWLDMKANLINVFGYETSYEIRDEFYQTFKNGPLKKEEVKESTMPGKYMVDFCKASIKKVYEEKLSDEFIREIKENEFFDQEYGDLSVTRSCYGIVTDIEFNTRRKVKSKLTGRMIDEIIREKGFKNFWFNKILKDEAPATNNMGRLNKKYNGIPFSIIVSEKQTLVFETVTVEKDSIESLIKMNEEVFQSFQNTQPVPEMETVNFVVITSNDELYNSEPDEGDDNESNEGDEPDEYSKYVAYLDDDGQ
jgi:hypothetical protein